MYRVLLPVDILFIIPLRYMSINGVGAMLLYRVMLPACTTLVESTQ